MTSKADQVAMGTRKFGFPLLSGALAGFFAAIPMALVMAGLNEILPTRKRAWYQKWIPLPPRQITNRMAKRFGVPRATRAGNRLEPATWLAHLGYGAAAASVFPLATRSLPIPAVLRGLLFALGVWAASYLGWLPAANILPPATEQPARRNIVMIISHLVWGSFIGLLASRIDTRFRSG